MAVHSLGFVMVVLSLIAASFVFVRAFRARGQRGWANYSVLTGIVAPLLMGFGFATQTILAITTTAFILFTWVSAISMHFYSGSTTGSK